MKGHSVIIGEEKMEPRRRVEKGRGLTIFVLKGAIRFPYHGRGLEVEKGAERKRRGVTTPGFSWKKDRMLSLSVDAGNRFSRTRRGEKKV